MVCNNGKKLENIDFTNSFKVEDVMRIAGIERYIEIGKIY